MLLIEGASSLANSSDVAQASLAVTLGVLMLFPAAYLVTEAARNPKTMKRAAWVRRAG
jgi:hypothetical protein